MHILAQDYQNNHLSTDERVFLMKFIRTFDRDVVFPKNPNEDEIISELSNLLPARSNDLMILIMDYCNREKGEMLMRKIAYHLPEEIAIPWKISYGPDQLQGSGEWNTILNADLMEGVKSAYQEVIGHIPDSQSPQKYEIMSSKIAWSRKEELGVFLNRIIDYSRTHNLPLHKIIDGIGTDLNNFEITDHRIGLISQFLQSDEYPESLQNAAKILKDSIDRRRKEQPIHHQANQEKGLEMSRWVTDLSHFELELIIDAFEISAPFKNLEKPISMGQMMARFGSMSPQSLQTFCDHLIKELGDFGTIALLSTIADNIAAHNVTTSILEASCRKLCGKDGYEVILLRFLKDLGVEDSIRISQPTTSHKRMKKGSLKGFFGRGKGKKTQALHN